MVLAEVVRNPGSSLWLPRGTRVSVEKRQLPGCLLILSSVYVTHVKHLLLVHAQGHIFVPLTRKLPGSIRYADISLSKEKTNAAGQICPCVNQECGLFGSSRSPFY